MSLIARLFQPKPSREALLPLYRAIVDLAREPAWYRDGQVPDTIDGRFDMVAAILSLVLLRLEEGGRETSAAAAWLTELFVDDMDGSLRQLGIGDLVVGKHVGRMMSALGGRLTAFRDSGSTREAVERNIFHGKVPGPEALDHVTTGLSTLRHQLAALPLPDLVEGRLPSA